MDKNKKMIKNPITSIILPAHNASQYIGNAIDSVLSQEYQNFELILIDDGSTDQTLAIMENYKKCDNRVRVLTRENKGLIYSLNEGVSLGRGEWIVRMDADDIFMPQRLTQQLNWLENTKSVVCGGWVKTFGRTLPKTRCYFTGNEAIKLQLLFNSCFAHPTVVARKSIFKNFPYSDNAEYGEDYDLWARLAAANTVMTNYPGVVLKYRIHANQITNKKAREQIITRTKIANWYRLSCFSNIGNAETHNTIMSRGEKLSHEKVANAVSFFNELIKSTGDPESSVTENAFIFLARHSNIGVKMMRQFCCELSITKKRKSILLLLSTLKADQSSILYKTLYRVK